MDRIDLLAVLIAALVNMVVGMIYYGPIAGKRWMKLSGVTASDTKGAGPMYAINFFTTIVLAAALSYMMNTIGTADIYGAVKVGAFVAVGFIMTTNATQYIWSKAPGRWELFGINMVYHLIATILMAVTLVLV